MGHKDYVNLPLFHICVSFQVLGDLKKYTYGEAPIDVYRQGEGPQLPPSGLWRRCLPLPSVTDSKHRALSTGPPPHI